MNVKIKNDLVTISGVALDIRPSKTMRESNGTKGNMLLASESSNVQVTLPDGRTIQARIGLNLSCKPHLLASEAAPAPVAPAPVAPAAVSKATQRDHLLALGWTEQMINETLGHPRNPAKV